MKENFIRHRPGTLRQNLPPNTPTITLRVNTPFPSFLSRPFFPPTVTTVYLWGSIEHLNRGYPVVPTENGGSYLEMGGS